MALSSEATMWKTESNVKMNFRAIRESCLILGFDVIGVESSGSVIRIRHLECSCCVFQDICRCSVFYADQMSDKVEGMGESQNVYEKKFEVTNEVRCKQLRRGMVSFVTFYIIQSFLLYLEIICNKIASNILL